MRMLLILTNLYDPSMPSWPEVMSVYGKHLPARGHKIDWVMPERAPMFGPVRKTSFHSCTLFLIPFSRSSNPVVFLVSSMVYQLRLLLLMSSQLRGKEYDIVQVRDDELSAMNALLQKRLNGVALAYNKSYPHYADALNQRQYFGMSSVKLLYYRLMQFLLVNIILRGADIVLPISMEMLEEFKAAGIPEEKMHPLPLGADTDVFNEGHTGRGLRERYGIPSGDLVLIYVGSMARMRGLDILISSFKEVAQRHSRVRMMLVGDGEALEDLRRQAKEYGLDDRVTFTGRVPYGEVPDHIAAADVGLSIIRPLNCYRVSSPCKVFEYMAMGRPVIANVELPEHRRVVSAAGCGVLTEYSVQGIAGAMERMITIHDNQKNLFINMGGGGRSWVMTNRTFEIISKEIEKAYGDAV
ncbi:MAG: glycosyltransferase [Methanomassiliicoccus sp.]|nr:glycosyltransferase [Methanomassiliicoccus sp.]